MNLSVNPEDIRESQTLNTPSKKKRWLVNFVLTGVFIVVIISVINYISDFITIPGPQHAKSNLPFPFDLAIVIGTPIFVFCITICIHELGHVIAALTQKFRVVYVVLGPIKFTKTATRWCLNLSGFNIAHIGHTLAIPTSTTKLSRRILIYVSGGPIATLFQLLFLLTLRLLLNDMIIPSFLGIILDMTTVVSGFVLFLSLLPQSSNEQANDGTTIYFWLTYKTKAHFECINFRLLQKSVEGKRPSQWEPELIQELISYAETPLEQAIAHMKAYSAALDYKDFVEASVQLNDALSSSTRTIHLSWASMIVFEAAYYEATIHNEAQLSREWFNLGHEILLDRDWRTYKALRAEAAVFLAERHYDHAFNQAKQGLKLLENHYDLGEAIAEKEMLEKILDRAQEGITTSQDKDVDVKPRINHHRFRSRAKPYLIISLALLFINLCFFPLAAIASNSGIRYQILGGLYCCLMRDKAKAFEMYSRGIAADPEGNHYNYYHRGEIYLMWDQYDEALADFEKAIALEPDDAEAYMGRGVVYYNLGVFAAAAADFSHSLELEQDARDLVDIYFYRAAAYSYIDEYEMAAADYRQIIAITDDPEVKAKAESYLAEVSD